MSAELFFAYGLCAVLLGTWLGLMIEDAINNRKNKG
jgi:LytS/YehU family sensor histidine kinase